MMLADLWVDECDKIWDRKLGCYRSVSPKEFNEEIIKAKVRDCPLCQGKGQVDPNNNSTTVRLLQLMITVLDRQIGEILKGERLADRGE